MTIEAEQFLLGNLFIDPSKISKANIDAKDFHCYNYEMIFTTMLDLHQKGELVDVVSVADSLSKQTNKALKGWLELCVMLQNDCFKSNDIMSSIKLIKENKRIQELASIGETLILEAKAKLIGAEDRAIQRLMNLNAIKQKYEYTIKEGLIKTTEYLDQHMNCNGLVGIDTGFNSLNKILSGFRESDLIIIAGRPAMGKTALMLNMVYAAKKNVGVISAEQGVVQVCSRMISKVGRVHTQRIRVAEFEDSDWTRITSAVSELSELGIVINDKPGQSITDVIRQARNWKYNYNIDALYIDYLQKINATNTNIPKHEQVAQIASSLKDLAKELNIPVIALSQVNRTVESRQSKRPTMGDLSDSSAIEKEADVIMTMYRDEVYNPGTDQKGILDLSIEKNRHGPTGMIQVKWEGAFMNFSDLENNQYDEPY